ncbi:glycerate kinase [Polaromonas sp. SM01]|uniref:glycerate kinase n=1 Tax=Polaromonas sp. SM01 TaxID=3085630 RepID=UPI002980EF2C|nr:glycerate kinase [Polaromonas sp. SM01]MDW5440982.1 glycerate kinase [Polaromonas sp. SM01]
MKFQKILVPIAGVALVVLAYRSFGWAGVAAAASGLVMWILLHFTRMLQVLKRAANRPIGHVDSAVMLNAKLRPGLTLLHVVAMTRSLGELLSPKDEQPEIYRWTDSSESSVTATFVGGKLSHHTLFRPAPEESQALAAPESSPAAAAPPSAP